MALVKFSRREFEKYVKLTKETEEKIAMFGTPLESVSNDEISIEIFPNRPDLLSLHGYLRSFLAFIGKKKGLREYKVNKPLTNYEVFIDKSVAKVRPYTACAIVKGIRFDNEKIKEVIDVQEKIHATLGRNRKKIAIGIYPLEAISLPIIYKAEKPQDIKFVPLGEKREMSGLQILQQHPTGKEYASLLDGKEKFPIFVDSKNEILSMPPIINSENTGKINEKTRDVFIECSGFELATLKRTLNIIVTMFADLGGEIYQMRLRYDKNEVTPDLKPERIKIDINKAEKLLGIKLKENQVKELLERMCYNYSKGEVLIPSWRDDILHEVDIYEDIAIAYGYENFEPEIPTVVSIGKEDKREMIKRKISEILIGLNLIEISTYHLLMKDDLKKLSGKFNESDLISVERSKTDYSILRKNLLCSSLKILGENIDVEYPQKIFEVGKVFGLDNAKETGISESENLIVSFCPGNFTEVKQVLDYLTRYLNSRFEIEEYENLNFIEGRVGKILVDGKEVGFIGEIHPAVLKNFHIKMPVSCFELSLDEVFRKLLDNNQKNYKSFSSQ